MVFFYLNRLTDLIWLFILWLKFNMTSYYYSFKIFPRFWLVKTTRINHHNHAAAVHQIWKESSPYSINDVKSAARCRLLNQWRQNDVKSAARCRLLNRWPRQPGDEFFVLVLVSRNWKQNKERNGETPLRTGKYFERIIKHLLNSAFVG